MQLSWEADRVNGKRLEPVIEASLLFFVLMMFVWGMLKAESEEMVLNH